MDGDSQQQKMTDLIIFIGMGLAIGFAWFKVYAEPREQFIVQVMDCMAENGDIHSELMYENCAKEVRGK